VLSEQLLRTRFELAIDDVASERARLPGRDFEQTQCIRTQAELRAGIEHYHAEFRMHANLQEAPDRHDHTCKFGKAGTDSVARSRRSARVVSRWPPMMLHCSENLNRGR
jgi:hypothetical protein